VAGIAARVDGLFSGRTSIRTPRERKVALSLLVTVPVTLAVIGFVFHGITPTQVALLFVAGMVYVSLARGRLLGSSIRARPDEFPDVVRSGRQSDRDLDLPRQRPLRRNGDARRPTRDIESDLTLRLGELTGMMPYAVNRVRVLETFAATPTYAYWMERFERDPLPVRAALGANAGPVDRRELASNLRRFLAFASVLSVIFQAVKVSVSSQPDHPVHGLHFVSRLHFSDIGALIRDNAWLVYFPYAAALVALAGRTIGMMVLDLRVVRLDHGRVGIAHSVWRYFLAWCSTLIVVPVLFGLFRRVQLHDRWSKSRLIGGRTGLS
jgi:hypothetical protein